MDVLPDRNAHTRAKSPLYLMVDSYPNYGTKCQGWISSKPPDSIWSRAYFHVFRVFCLFWSFLPLIFLILGVFYYVELLNVLVTLDVTNVVSV